MNGRLEFLRVELEFVVSIRRSPKIHLIAAAAQRELEIREEIAELEVRLESPVLAVGFAQSRDSDADPET